MKKYLLVALVVVLAGCGFHVDDIKAHAEETFLQAGYEIQGYEGYSYSQWGGCVWYTLKRLPDNGIAYHACISKRAGEYHIYELTAIDAIKP